MRNLLTITESQYSRDHFAQNFAANLLASQASANPLQLRLKPSWQQSEALLPDPFPMIQKERKEVDLP